MTIVSNLLRQATAGLGAFPYPGEERELTLLERIQWLVRARWVGVVGFTSIAALLRLLRPHPFGLLLSAGLFVAVYNALATLYLQVYRKRAGPLLWPGELRLVFHVPQLLDLFIAAVLIHLTGGVESFLWPVYLVYVPTGALILPRAMTYMYTTAVVVVLAALAGLEYFGVLSHHYVYGGPSPGLYRRGSFVLAVLGLQAFLLCYAAYVATLITSRLRTQARHRQTVAEVSRRISSILAPERLLQDAVSLVAEAFGYHYVGIFLLDEAADELVLQAEATERPPAETGEYRQAVGEGMIGSVARSGQLLLANDIEQQPRYLDSHPETRSELDVPLAHGGRILGVLSVQSTELNAFQQEDVNTVQTLADQIAVAIRNVELYSAQETAEGALRRQAEELAARNAIARAVSRSLEIDEVLERLYEQIDRLLQPDTVFIALYYERQERFEVALAVEDGKRLPSVTVKLEEAGGLTTWVIQERRPLLVQDLLDENEELPAKPRHMTRPARSWLAVPLVAHDRVVGVLSVQHFRPGVFGREDQAFLSAVADQVAIAIENARLYEETRRQALTDGLTGLYNVRYFYRTLEQELERSRRHGHSCSLIILDLDEFKKYNDHYGHLAGDNLLRELSDLMSDTIRAEDILARYGGEEFAVVLPETDAGKAANVAERLRQTVAGHRFEMGDEGMGGRITLSAGVATYPRDAGDVEGLVNAADMALLHAKQGKNRVALFRDMAPGGDHPGGNSEQGSYN